MFFGDIAVAALCFFCADIMVVFFLCMFVVSGGGIRR
jgi:hypothetical protein